MQCIRPWEWTQSMVSGSLPVSSAVFVAEALVQRLLCSQGIIQVVVLRLQLLEDMLGEGGREEGQEMEPLETSTTTTTTTTIQTTMELEERPLLFTYMVIGALYGFMGLLLGLS